MKIAGLDIPNEALWIAGALVLLPVGISAYRFARGTARVVGAAADSAGDFVDRRLDDPNLFASIANGVVEVFTFDRNQTLGGLVFDLTHPNAGK